MQPANMAYDRAITVFSPDGRLFQVEYAREAVKRGTTTVGLKFKNGVVLIVDKRITSHLIEPGSIEKIFAIDKHIGCATSGLVADARALIDRARVDAQINEITYNEISNNDDGIYLLGSSYNTITKNNVSENNDGVYLIFCIDWFYKTQSLGNTIIQNNFFRNKRHAFCGGDWSNTWVENYWNKPRYLPKIIFGKILLSEHYLIIPLIIPWINFDWHPAKLPYDIEV